MSLLYQHRVVIPAAVTRGCSQTLTPVSYRSLPLRVRVHIGALFSRLVEIREIATVPES